MKNLIPESIPRVSASTLPTSVRQLSAIAENVFVKEDNLSGPIYGGNKVRKLDFLLGEALAEGRRSVITYGAAGSNHALATAVYCREFGLKAISILAPQETSAHVRKNILMGQSVGAELILCNHFNEFPEVTEEITNRCTTDDGIAPYIIPAGGTNATGALGFVNAVFEMVDQVEPDVIYIPMGTGGTHAGLLVGLKLAGLNTRVEAIRVTDPIFRTEKHIKKLCDEICAKLNIDPIVDDADIIIRDEFYGEGYGIPTDEGREAVELFQSKEGIYLENTYTGKTVAALLHDLRTGKLDGQKVLYWNTLNSRDFSDQISDVDYHDLPEAFHSYFE